MHFHVVVVLNSDGKEIEKKRAAREKLLFCQSKPIAFLPFLLTSPPSLLKLPNNKKVMAANRHFFGREGGVHIHVCVFFSEGLSKQFSGIIPIFSIALKAICLREIRLE